MNGPRHIEIALRNCYKQLDNDDISQEERERIYGEIDALEAEEAVFHAKAGKLSAAALAEMAEEEQEDYEQSWTD